MLQFEKRLDHSQNHKLCTQGPFFWSLFCSVFCSPQFTVTKRQPISLSAVTIPQALSRKSFWQMLEIWRKHRVYYPLSFDAFNISTFKSCLKCLNPTNFPPVSCSSQACVSGSVSKLPCIWCKEIRELVRKQFNQSITTLWWTAVWWQKFHWHLAPQPAIQHLQFSSNDSFISWGFRFPGRIVFPISKLAFPGKVSHQSSWNSWNPYSRILWKRYLTTPSIESAWLWSRSIPVYSNSCNRLIPFGHSFYWLLECSCQESKQVKQS